MMCPRVFVGTMYCGEGDFKDACEAIASQRTVVVSHVVIKNLPEKEAHNQLWRAWRDAKSTHNMFVKVDADTVLAHDEVLFEFWNLMSSNSRITGIQAPLYDYFTDGYVNGLNCFSPKVTFQNTTDQLFCDRQVDVDHDIVVGSDSVPERLRHAGYHCFHATDEQAFHFGVHRALKGQVHVLERVKQAWKNHNDRQRALVLLGAKSASLFTNGGFNYSDELFVSTFRSTMSQFDELKGQL